MYFLCSLTRLISAPNRIAQPRGVGFARMDSKEKCDMIISTFNGKVIPGSKEPLLVKFADGGNKKKNQVQVLCARPAFTAASA